MIHYIMDIVQLDLIELPNLSYILLPFVIICIGQFFESIVAKGKREKITSHERELYYQKLAEESYKMEEKAIKEELELTKNIENLQFEGEEIKEQLEEDDSDWSAESYVEGSIHLSKGSDGELKVEQLKKELEIYQEESKELQLVEADICKLSKDIAEISSEEVQLVLEGGEDPLLKLTERINQLENDNDSLKSQLMSQSPLPQLVNSEKNLDPDLLKYLQDHNDELTLSFLEKAHETLLELKASYPEKSFDDYIDELKNSQTNYVKELASLRLSKKEVEIKLQLMKRRYEEELSNFNEIRIEHLFKNSGAKEYLERLKEKNRLKDDIISNLKRDIETKKNELKTWQQKYHDSDAQCSFYWKSWKDTQVRKEQLEAEKRASLERERRLQINQSMNLSSASSFVDNQVPPPPPIDVPPVDEILRLSRRHSSNQYSSNSIDTSIPPPPPLVEMSRDLSYNDIYRQSERSFN